MSELRFKNFGVAQAYARALACEAHQEVTVRREGSEWVVERGPGLWHPEYEEPSWESISEAGDYVEDEGPSIELPYSFAPA